MPSRFERFTPRARHALAAAQDEATRLNQAVRPEHLLLGLVADRSSVASRLLASFDIDLDQLCATLLEQLSTSTDADEDPAPGLTRRTQVAVQLAIADAEQLGHSYVGTEHLLQGLIGEGTSRAFVALAALGVTPERTRPAVLELLSAPAPRAPSIPARRGRDRPVNAPPPAEMQQLVGELLAYMADPDATREPTTRLFHRVGDDCRIALTYAMEEAERLQHTYIGTEHQLLGLVRSTGAAALTLASLGVSIDKVRNAVEFIIGRGDRQVPRHSIGFTPRARRVIELTVTEADELGHDEIGPDHLLLGLLREGEGIAAGVLQSLGVDLEVVRSTVRTRLL